jgi:PAS domain S-box-containing protein
VAEQLTEWTSAEAMGRDLREVFHIVKEDTDRDLENPALRALKDGAIVGPTSHTLLVSKNGRERLVEESAGPVRLADGTVDGSVLVFRDVSERRRSLEALRRSEQELRDFFNSATIALHWLDPDGTILRANQAELDLLGYREDEYVGRSIADFHEDRAAIADILARLHAGEVLQNQPARLRARNGSIKDVLISASALWDQGKLIHIRSFTLDVTDRKRAEAGRGLLAAVVESSEDAVISKTLDGRILSWNAGASAMFGYSAEEAIGRHVNFIVPERFHGQEQDFLARVGRGERVESFETMRVGRDGRALHVSLTLSPVRDEAGTIVGASSIARDIRRRKELEQSLLEADRRKDEFLAVLAHELRNPLAPIRNSVSTLQLASLDDPDLRRAAAIIERQTGHMSRLLDDLLDVSRITRSKLDLRMETIVVQSVLDAAVETSRPLIDAAGQTLALDVPPEPIHVRADPMRLGQVFSNLLNNASKYSKRGSLIRMSARREPSDVVVTVVDDGIGISAEALPTIFEMFSQAEPALDRAQGGLGIGLSLVKGLVELHGGRVKAASEGAGRGSTFEVRLPIAVTAQVRSPSASLAAPSAAPRRVLIADDNQDGADSLFIMLRRFGHDVRVVYDGLDAVREAEAFAPDVVLLDLGMPGMNGFEAARRLRALPCGGSMTLIAVTGWGQDRDRQLTTEAGFDAHVVKPVDVLAIKNLLATLPARSR